MDARVQLDHAWRACHARRRFPALAAVLRRVQGVDAVQMEDADRLAAVQAFLREGRMPTADSRPERDRRRAELLLRVQETWKAMETQLDSRVSKQEVAAPPAQAVDATVREEPTADVEHDALEAALVANAAKLKETVGAIHKTLQKDAAVLDRVDTAGEVGLGTVAAANRRLKALVSDSSWSLCQQYVVVVSVLATQVAMVMLMKLVPKA